MIKEKKDKKRYDEILSLLSSSGKITAGVHNAEGVRTYPSGQTILDIAEAAEFGLAQPVRSWLREWFDAHKTEIEAQLEREYVKAFERGESFEVAAERVAQWMAASMQRRIRNRIPPPNHPTTVEKKGSSTPLIDTGRFRSAIMGRVMRVA